MQFVVAEVFATLIPAARFPGAVYALSNSYIARINEYAIHEVLRCASQYVSGSVDEHLRAYMGSSVGTDLSIRGTPDKRR
jgi:hypothetical protein